MHPLLSDSDDELSPPSAEVKPTTDLDGLLLDEDSNIDPKFNPEMEIAANPDLKLEQFVKDWVLFLDYEDRACLLAEVAEFHSGASC